MVQRFIKIIVVCSLIVFSKQVNGQINRLTVVPKPLFGQALKLVASHHETQAANSFHAASTPYVLPSFSVINQSLYTQQFGFFCRKEFQFEKKTSIPFRFRLGSLDYVNKLEGK
jgi:hypothetical protein